MLNSDKPEAYLPACWFLQGEVEVTVGITQDGFSSHLSAEASFFLVEGKVCDVIMTSQPPSAPPNKNPGYGAAHMAL